MSVLAASPGRQLADGDGSFPSLFSAASPSPRILSRQQIQSFKDDGVLILEDFVSKKQVESWKAQGWERLGVDPEDPAGWSDRKQTSNDDPLTPCALPRNDLSLARCRNTSFKPRFQTHPLGTIFGLALVTKNNKLWHRSQNLF